MANCCEDLDLRKIKSYLKVTSVNCTANWWTIPQSDCWRPLAHAALRGLPSPPETQTYMHVSPIIAPTISHWQYGDQNSLLKTHYFCLMRRSQNKTFRDFVCQNLIDFILKKQTNQNVSDGQLIWKRVLNTAKRFKCPATCHTDSVDVPRMVMSAHTSHAKHQGKSSGWHVRNSFCKLQRSTMLDSFEHQAPRVITAASLSSWGDCVQLTARTLIPKK